MSVEQRVLAQCAAGEVSPQVALARLILFGARPDPARLAEAATNAPPNSPLRALATLAREQAGALARLDALAAAGIDPEGEDMIAATRALFDRMATASPEAAVAFYSLGDAELLDAATAELAAVIHGWTAIDERDLLDFGCGIGRIAIALAPRAASVIGVDLSPAMLAEAERRARGMANIRFVEGSGRDLAFLPNRGIDVMIAADSFPYLVRAGADVLDRHLAEAARVLRPEGELIVFNWSYRGDVAEDVREAAALAACHGFALTRAGERPFTIWDGIGFALRRAA